MAFATVARGLDIEVTANRSDEEPGRLIRLQRVLGFVQGLASHYGNLDLLNKVASVHDHKGELTVGWRERPTAGEMELFSQAWNNPVIGDAWGPVEHLDKDGRLIQHYEGPGSTFSGGIVQIHFQ